MKVIGNGLSAKENRKYLLNRSNLFEKGTLAIWKSFVCALSDDEATNLAGEMGALSFGWDEEQAGE